ncbi:MAG: hypothetical protein ACX94B_00780 [Henriciella sp.]|nr:hypothetical protein [Hyphomonadaceae bacterium]
MSLAGYEIFALIGFFFAAYAVIANDSIQTLGTFLASNSHRPWWLLWMFAAGIMVAALIFQLFFGGGDIADGKLNKIPYPEGGIQWWHALPPIVLLFLTRFGIPVSTTFLVLTVFALSGGSATEGVMGSMLLKSLLGYVVAFAAGAAVWLLISRMWEVWVGRTRDDDERLHPMWTVFQWGTTGFLWWTWLLQDFANIFVFMPREPVFADDGTITMMVFKPEVIVGGALLMAAMMAYIFKTRGGEIQKIVLSKTHTTDIRAATIVDLIYAIVLFYFKEMNDVPMSTTWVFLGLLAGREMAISFVTALRERGAAMMDVGSDAGRALIGLVISVILAVGMPWAATGQMPTF